MNGIDTIISRQKLHVVYVIFMYQLLPTIRFTGIYYSFEKPEAPRIDPVVYNYWLQYLVDISDRQILLKKKKEKKLLGSGHHFKHDSGIISQIPQKIYLNILQAF